MKLASFVAEGKDCFGAVVGDGVVTLNGKLPYATLRDALKDQQGLYTLVELGAAPRARVIGAIREMLVGAADQDSAGIAGAVSAAARP